MSAVGPANYLNGFSKGLQCQNQLAVKVEKDKAVLWSSSKMIQ